jgi:NAD(P)-dependent dehydrogenase (short-subunit alcohol dehydrogenase family)
MTKTVLITGASTGIGRAAAELFQREGWNVAATMRTPEKAAGLAALPNVITPRLDVLDEASIESAIAETVSKFGKIDVLVNNAGYGLVGPFEASTDAQIRRQFDTNVFGLMNVARAMLPHFRERKDGVIINIASVGGRVTFPLYSLYHGTKWAVEGFTESLQFELREHNVRVKIIEPGPIKTDFYDRSQDLMEKPGLTAYDTYVKRVLPNMSKAGENAPGPEVTARVIYRAATDGSRKLRYSSNSLPLLIARRLLPQSWFFAMVRAALKG